MTLNKRGHVLGIFASNNFHGNQNLYDNIPTGDGPDQVSWILTGNGQFDIRSYYEALRGSTGVCFPCKSGVIKLLERWLLAWKTMWGKFFTYENLMKRRITLVNWCYKCRCNGENAYHLIVM